MKDFQKQENGNAPAGEAQAEPGTEEAPAGEAEAEAPAAAEPAAEAPAEAPAAAAEPTAEEQ